MLEGRVQHPSFFPLAATMADKLFRLSGLFSSYYQPRTCCREDCRGRCAQPRLKIKLLTVLGDLPGPVQCPSLTLMKAILANSTSQPLGP